MRLWREEVDLRIGAIEWGVEWEARQYEASRGVVAVVAPLVVMLKRAVLDQGGPGGKQLVCPPTRPSRSRWLNWLSLGVSALKMWREARLVSITLQESRYWAARWLDAAGVRPKIASVLMAHATPARQPGAARITHARKKLAAYLAEHQETKARDG